MQLDLKKAVYQFLCIVQNLQRIQRILDREEYAGST